MSADAVVENGRGGELIAERVGPVGWITFSNVARHNAVTLAMWQTLPVLLQAFAEDPEVRVVVLKGAGDKAFVAGADISEFERERADPEAVGHHPPRDRFALLTGPV